MVSNTSSERPNSNKPQIVPSGILTIIRLSKNIYHHIAILVFTALLIPKLTLASLFEVETTKQLKDAIVQASLIDQSIPITIILRKGFYKNATNLNLTRPNITIRSDSLQAQDVVLSGSGMRHTYNTEVIFYVSASNIKIEGITMQSVANHLIQVRAENNADFFLLKNCILLDAFEQLLKISANANGEYSDFGRITGNYFGYSKGLGPQYYIGGIDAHHARFWKVDQNHFYGIASPSLRSAQHAIHFWNDSANILVANNVIINSDRGIGIGLTQRSQAKNALISNNIIFQTGAFYPYEDAGIILENVTRSLVRNNRVYLNTYPKAVENRYGKSTDILIKDNWLNREIVSEHGTSAFVSSNQIIEDQWTRLYNRVWYLHGRLKQMLKEW